MPISTYLKQKILDHIFSEAAYTAESFYVGLSSTEPVVGGTNITEPTIGVGGYGRIAVSAWTRATLNVSNDGVINFGTASANWSDSAVRYPFLCNHQTNVTWNTNVNLLAWADMGQAYDINSGDTFDIAAGNLDFDW